MWSQIFLKAKGQQSKDRVRIDDVSLVRKTRQGRSANRGVLWTRLTARAGHGRAVGCKMGVGREGGTQCHPKIEGEKEGGCENESKSARRGRVSDAPPPWRCFRGYLPSTEHKKVVRKRRWYAKEKEVTAAKDNRYRRKMIGCQLYPLFQVPVEVSGNRCRLPFAKHGRFAVWYLDIRNSPFCRDLSARFRLKSRIPLHESSIRQWNTIAQTLPDECITFIDVTVRNKCGAVKRLKM